VGRERLASPLLAAQFVKPLNCTPEDVSLLVTAGKFKPLGRLNHSVVKFFSAIEPLLLADCEWLDDATKTIVSSESVRIPARWFRPGKSGECWALCQIESRYNMSPSHRKNPPHLT